MTISNLFKFKHLAASDVSRRLARGSLWSAAGTGVSRLIMLATMICLGRMLEVSEFGELGVIQATLGVAGLMAGVGLGSTATRFIAVHVKADPPRAGRVISLVALSSIAAIALVGSILILLSGVIARQVLDAPNLDSTIVLGSALMAVQALRGVQNGILAGFEKFETISMLNIMEAFVCFAAAVYMAPLIGINGVIVGFAAGAAVALFAGLFLLRSELDSRAIRLDRRSCWSEWRILSSYSAPSFLGNLVATPVLWYAMTLVARSEAGYAGMGLYNAAYQWHGPLIFLPIVLGSVSVPILVREWEEGRRNRFRKIAFALIALLLSASIPLVLLLSVFSKEIMGLYGHEFVQGSMLLVLLLVAAPLHGASKIASAALLAMKRAWWVLWINLVWSASLLTCVALLLPAYGILGFAIAFLNAYLLLAVLSFGMLWFGTSASTSAATLPVSNADLK